MGYLKFQGRSLFDGRSLLEGMVLVADEDGIVADVIAAAEAGDDTVQVDGILSPGFVNCHCHLELSHMKGRIPENTGLEDFVYSVVTQRHDPEEAILLAIEQAEDEMLANGIVAVGDICNNELTIAQKAKGRIYYHNFIEASGFNPVIANERFQRSVGIFREYGRYYSVPVESNSIVPHAPYSVAEELWQLIIHFPGNHILTIHNQETLAENEWFHDKSGGLHDMYDKMKIDTSFFNASGKSSLQSYLGKFLPNQTLILVHNVHTSEEDVHFSKGTPIADNLYWCLCPNANRYITGSLPPVDMFVGNNCRIVIGTDSLASNHQLSVLSELSTISSAYPGIGLAELLSWATLNGAEALDLQNQLGSFEKGKRPGVIVIGEDLQQVRRIL